MANNQQFYRGEHQQRDNDWLAFRNTGGSVQLPDIQRTIKMAQVKMIWLICDIFGIPITLLGIVANIDNVKSAIIAILAISYLMLRGYFYFVQKNQAVREKDLEIWHKEIDKQERIKKMDENSKK